MALPALLPSGLLPLGRYAATEAEIAARFVDDPAFAASTTRSDIWDQYELARDFLATVVRVHAVWIGGTFTTAKPDPSDIDVTFVISARDYDKASPPDKQVVDSFVLKRRPPLGLPLRTHGLPLVDSYVLGWKPLADAHPTISPNGAEYCQMRGYWDDFWQRQRHGAKTDPPTWEDAPPRRGYLEVELNAFTR